MPLHDKSDPQAIKNELGMSKKSFKKAIGTLYKDKQIAIKPDGIELIDQNSQFKIIWSLSCYQNRSCQNSSLCTVPLALALALRD